uniref:PH domain-containing protein n=1 Tax=Panagrellus redivivus TaxID=6233 RepID=A0A7E4V3H7_PANRE
MTIHDAERRKKLRVRGERLTACQGRCIVFRKSARRGGDCRNPCLPSSHKHSTSEQTIRPGAKTQPGLFVRLTLLRDLPNAPEDRRFFIYRGWKAPKASHVESGWMDTLEVPDG